MMLHLPGADDNMSELNMETEYCDLMLDMEDERAREEADYLAVSRMIAEAES